MNANPLIEPTDEEVRKTAYLLYLASGCVPGRDLENWLSARSQMTAQELLSGEKAQNSATILLHFPPNANASRGPFDSLSPLENRN
jgi:hypothetical protein